MLQGNNVRYVQMSVKEEVPPYENFFLLRMRDAMYGHCACTRTTQGGRRLPRSHRHAYRETSRDVTASKGTTQFLVRTKSMEFLSKVKFFFVFHISIGRDGEFSMRAKYYHGMVRRGKCSMRMIAVLDEGIPLERQVCSKIDFSGDEDSCQSRLLKTSKKKSRKILQIGVSNLGDYIILLRSTITRNHYFCPKTLNFETFLA